MLRYIILPIDVICIKNYDKIYFITTKSFKKNDIIFKSCSEVIKEDFIDIIIPIVYDIINNKEIYNYKKKINIINNIFYGFYNLLDLSNIKSNIYIEYYKHSKYTDESKILYYIKALDNINDNEILI